MNEEEILNLFEKVGYGSKQIKLIFLTFLTLSTEGFSMTDISMMYTPVMKYYNMKDIHVMLATSLLFLGFAIGSLSLQLIKKVFSRKSILCISLLCISIFQGLIVISNNLALYIIIKFSIGIFLGQITPVIMNVLCEILPKNFRSFTINSVWVFFMTGQLIMLTAMLIAMPNFEVSGVKTVYTATLCFIVLSLVFVAILFEDSPRSLALSNNENEAIESLRQMFTSKNIVIREADYQTIVNYLKSGDNESFENSLFSLFQPNVLGLTISLTVISVMISLLRYGALILYNPAVEKLEITSSYYIIIGHVVTCSVGILVGLVTAFLSELRVIGLVKLSLLLYGICTIISLLMIIIPKSTNIWLSGYLMISKSGYVALTAYSTLIYPTKIRDISAGFFYSCKRFGSIASQFLFLSLFQVDYIIPFYLILVLTVLCITFIFMLPIEPNDHDLDREIKYIKS